MKNVLTCLISVCIILTGNGLLGQEYAYISNEGLTRIMRFDVMPAQWSIKPADSTARTAVGLCLNNEVKLLSASKRLTNSAFSVYDAFYFTLALGRMSSDPQTARNGDVEGRFSMMNNLGYQFLAGYRTQKWAALAGVDFRWQIMQVGKTQTPHLYGYDYNHNRALMLRGEYQLLEKSRVVAVFTAGLGGTPAKRPQYQNIRAMIQLGEESRWWLVGQYNHQRPEAWSNLHFAYYPNASTQQLMVGFHIGYLP